MYLLCDSEPSDQGAVCLQTHQILKRPKTKNKHTQVPFHIHLRNGRAVCTRSYFLLQLRLLSAATITVNILWNIINSFIISILFYLGEKF